MEEKYILTIYVLCVGGLGLICLFAFSFITRCTNLFKAEIIYSGATCTGTLAKDFCGDSRCINPICVTVRNNLSV